MFTTQFQIHTNFYSTLWLPVEITVRLREVSFLQGVRLQQHDCKTAGTNTSCRSCGGVRLTELRGVR